LSLFPVRTDIVACLVAPNAGRWSTDRHLGGFFKEIFMRRMFMTFVTFAVTIPLLAACGGGGSSTKTTNAATSGTTGAPGVTTGSGQASATSVPKFSGNSGSSWCDLVRSFKDNTKLQDITKDPKGWTNAANSAIDKVNNSAPGPIKDDIHTLVAALRAMIQVLAADNYDFKKITPDQLKTFSDQKFTDASTRIDAYDKQVCGVP
jgi:hypothetical protein